MKKYELANYLEHVNSWRRGEHEIPPNPKEYGIALDEAVKFLREKNL